MRAFLSYQTQDKMIAARIANLLGELGISAFMAHEHIEVSVEWRGEILKQLALADLFVPILSQHYYQSIWCKQESGIAAFRNLTLIPLSIDGSIPEGFIGHIQSMKVDQANLRRKDLVPALAKHDVSFLIDALISIIAKSGNYRMAEANFELILPYLDYATNEQVVKLLTVSASNDQVYDASLCIRHYLPPLFAASGHQLDEQTRKHLADKIADYAKIVPPAQIT